MSRETKWRQLCPELVNQRITKATEERLYILRQTGPTGFLVKGENSSKSYKVYLGNPHSCSCSNFRKDKELCIHILWILLRKFRVSAEDAIIYQLALVEREVNNVIQGFHSAIQPPRVKTPTKTKDDGEKDSLPQKLPEKDDVCSICQEPLKLKAQALTFCKFGCGNTIHTKCMKVYADHQKSNGETVVKCPLCRCEFGSFHEVNQGFVKQLNQQKRKESTVHVGKTCRSCSKTPIKGMCYRCCDCSDFYVCGVCIGAIIHPNHQFEWKKKAYQQWQLLETILPINEPMAIECNVLPLLKYFDQLSIGNVSHKKNTSRADNNVRPLPIHKKNKLSQREDETIDLMITGNHSSTDSSCSGILIRSAPVRKPLKLPPLSNSIQRSHSARISRSIPERHSLAASPLDNLLSVNGSPSDVNAAPSSLRTHTISNKRCNRIPCPRRIHPKSINNDHNHNALRVSAVSLSSHGEATSENVTN